MTETIEPMVELDEVERHQFAQQLVDQAKSEGVDLIGPGGLSTGLTKTVLETALGEEISEHLGVWPDSCHFLAGGRAAGL